MNTLITGAADGLGRALAERFKGGETVIITSRSEEKLSKTCKDLGCEGFVMNVANEQSVTDTIATILKRFGSIDCLINNAGLWIEGPLEDNPSISIEEVISTNLTGLIRVTRAVIPSMKARKSGLIININSENGLRAKKERSVYTASKWGVTGFTASMQEELAPHGIRVTGVHPGKMRTGLFSKAGVHKSMDDALDTEYTARTIEFIMSLPADVLIPHISIRSLKQ